MPTTHNRKLGLIGTALTKARNNKNDIRALTAVRNELEQILDAENYLLGAPFTWVTVAVRYGLVDAVEPTYQAINRKYGDLPLAIEIDANRLIGLDLEALTTVFRKAVLTALVHAGKKYGRPTEKLETLLAD